MGTGGRGVPFIANRLKLRGKRRRPGRIGRMAPGMLLAFAALGGRGLPVVAEEVEVSPPAAPVVQEGIWPSPKLMQLMLARWAEEVSDTYKLDDEQRLRVREGITQRWGTFLNERRSTIQPLINEFIELRMELEPPDKERVQAWAERALPVLDQFREQVREGSGEFRKVLKPMQRAKFELDALQFGVGLRVAEYKLKQWQGGEFEPEDFWEPVRRSERQENWQKRRQDREQHRQRIEQEASAESTGATADSSDQIALEMDAWEKHVAEFIERFRLDEGQQSAARSFLSELKGRALAHRDRRRDDILKLEERIAQPTNGEAEVEEIKKKLVELYGPIDDLFQELQKRLESLPTAPQRAAASVKAPEVRASPQKAQGKPQEDVPGAPSTP